MPTFFYEAPSFTLRGLFRPEFDVLDGLPFYTTALISLAVALAVAVGLVLARARTRRLSPSPNAVHFAIRMAALKSMRVVGCGVRGRNG